MQSVEVDGLRITYERAGSGAPVVLVHGYVGDGPSTWRPQLTDLADEFDVIAWDAPGAGGTSDPPEVFRMADFADCLAGFIRVLDLTAPHVVGLSFGGAIVIELCRRHPLLLRTATLVGAYAGWGGSLPREEADRRLHQALELAELAPADLVGALLPTMFSGSASAEMVAGFRQALAAFHPAGLRTMAVACAEDLSSALPLIEVPTLLVYGVDDERAPAEVAAELHHSIIGSELVVLPGAGHVCNVDAAEDFNDALRRFLHRHPAS